MGMDTVCAVTDGDGLIFHYRSALYTGMINPLCFVLVLRNSTCEISSDNYKMINIR